MIGITMPNNINNTTLARSVSLYTEYIISTQQGNERNKTTLHCTLPFALHYIYQHSFPLRPKGLNEIYIALLIVT